MKKLFLFLAIAMSMGTFSIAQAYKDSWQVGFGFVYPRFVGADIISNEGNYGIYASAQRKFSEHFGMRFKLAFKDLRGKYIPTVTPSTQTLHFSGDFDVLYSFVPCEAVSPYFGVGIGPLYYQVNNPTTTSIKDGEWMADYQVNFLFGVDFNLNADWKVNTELAYHTVSTGRFDGRFDRIGGMLGGPYVSYMTFNLGALYYFEKGEPSKYCQIYDGITQKVEIDYSKIEDIVRRYQQKPVEIDYNRIEDIVKKYGAAPVKDSWVLIGVNYDFNKATLRPESFPILVNAIEVLSNNPSIKVEIQGHTDNIGSDTFNRNLAARRAETVKRFLVANGIDAGRLTTVGVGEAKPIADNNTEEGRALNRRIEFKVLSK
ncbi:MAG: hypothetical protein C0425_04330 [Chlorobiaceae bacterium]|nr:hypothetical protein [Chlorobiaceae bacterium]MBA4309544.1 hypothetical protein [Chlorobiaceae bacterium]